MLLFSIARVIKFAAQNIWRNIGLSFMTVVILVVTLLSVNVLIALSGLTQHVVTSVKEKVDVSIYFSPDAEDNQVQEVREFLLTFPEVKDLTLKTRDMVLEEFKEKHKSNPDVLASLDELGDNPLGPTLVIQTHEPGQYETIFKSLDTPELNAIVEGKTFDANKDVINKLQVITTYVERFMLGITALFAVIAFLIIFNTIRVAIYTQREEISIKKLVGASNWFIRMPFLLDGIVYTVVSLGITVLIMYGGLNLLDGYVQIMSNSGFSLIQYFRSTPLIFVYQIVGVLLLTWTSSALAMRKYLRA